MKIQIIGPGVVGNATGVGFARFGHSVIYRDKGNAISNLADIHLVCTPEEAVPDVVRELVTLVSTPIVVRSSTSPGTLRKLAHELDRALWHNPEFLREAVAEHDFLNSAYTLVGYAGPGDEDDFLQNCDALDALYGTMNVHPLYCAATESELAKLATNAYLATQISFWNQMQWLAEELGVNSHQVARLVALDSRVSPYGAFMHGKPYSGPCLPKDVAQLLALSLSDPEPVPTPLLEAVQRINLMMGGA